MVFLYGPGQPDQAGRDFLYKKEQTLESLVHILVQSQDDIQPIPKGRLENILFLFIGSLIWLSQLRGVRQLLYKLYSTNFKIIQFLNHSLRH